MFHHNLIFFTIIFIFSFGLYFSRLSPTHSFSLRLFPLCILSMFPRFFPFHFFSSFSLHYFSFPFISPYYPLRLLSPLDTSFSSFLYLLLPPKSYSSVSPSSLFFYHFLSHLFSVFIFFFFLHLFLSAFTPGFFFYSSSKSSFLLLFVLFICSYPLSFRLSFLLLSPKSSTFPRIFQPHYKHLLRKNWSCEKNKIILIDDNDSKCNP